MADDKLIFVGGCMRTGTTILHRVLCSSPASHPYITESWYLLDQLRIYVWSLKRYDVRQKDYFGEKENFDEFTRDIVRNYIRMIRTRYAPATAVILKNPELTGYFPLLAKWFDQARFVVNVRDPRDTIASMVEVGARHRADGAVTPQSRMGRNMKKRSNFYLKYYTQFLAGGKDLMRKSLVVRYEDLMGETEKTVESLSRFLDLPLDMEAIRNFDSRTEDSANLDAEKRKEDWLSRAFWSDLYTKNLSTERIGRHREVLTPEEIAEIETHCAKFNAAVPYW